MSKILLVTGASSDIGVALIKKIAKNYDYVIAHFNSTNQLLEPLTCKNSRILTLQGDFSSEIGTRNFIDRLNQTGLKPDDIVLLPAPKAKNIKFIKSNWDDFSAGIDVGFRSAVMILQNCITHMNAQKYGKIIFMLTSCTLNNPPKFQSPYVSAKYAMLGLMKSLAVEFASKGIAINAISPDMVETKFLSNIPELIVQQQANANPLGRNINIDDIIPAFEYLLLHATTATTGQNIAITGGL